MTSGETVTADLTIDGVRRASSEASQQQTPAAKHYLTFVGMLLVLCLYIGPFISFPIVQRLPMTSWHWSAPLFSIMIPVILFLVGITVINNWYNRRAVSAYDRSWDNWEIPATVSAIYEITQAGLSMKTERGEFVAYWPSVAKIAKVSDGWMVLSDLSSYLIPSKAFVDEEAERDFLSSMVRQISASAVARSPEASNFALSDDATGDKP